MTHPAYLLRRLALVWLLLAAIPSLLLLTQNQLFPLLDLQSPLARALYWLTTTGTAPYGVATVLVVLALAYCYMPKALFINLFLAISLSQVLSLSTSHALKSFFKEPRPNLVYLSEQALPDDAQLTPQTFYQLAKPERSQAISEALTELQTRTSAVKLSPKIHQHWEDEIGYSFPSGHTIFAVTLVLTASYYLLLAGLPLFTSALLVWGLLMGLSRMLLGMHWPQDVLFSTLLAAIISSLSIFLVSKMRLFTQRFAKTSSQ
ncbi:phosphatase PAP2 family protein [Shewanella xiamenensis]|uniref:phosphatase PAP2 family protein n=1 Tax=Shewanella xiamenensis TaxID=332186 RepID=UPI00217E49F2|nr:phosphatase PAP2 family protein [Shewanella xiamenensis]MCT8861581.1 phosphatase PAP2 family protein [Shewanella xiamenensis]UWG64326.1 phosphatase PAP2 family protein [Shewanella xiamenensis]